MSVYTFWGQAPNARRRGVSLLGGLLLVIGVLQIPMGGPALAATHYGFRVNTFQDTVDIHPASGKCSDSSGNCSLRGAVQAAEARGGAANITLGSPGTYTLSIPPSGDDDASTGDLNLTTNVTFSPPPGGGVATIMAAPGFGDRLFDIPAGVSPSVTFRGQLVLSGGTAPAGQNGGAIQDLGGGPLTLSGGGRTGQLQIVNNSAVSGGGLYFDPSAGGSLSMTLVTFSGNVATQNGGGLDVEGDGSASLNRDTATGNQAQNGGGLAAYLSPGASGSLAIYGGWYNTNVAGSTGGGMDVSNTTVETYRSQAAAAYLSGNRAAQGGGLAIDDTNGPSSILGNIMITGNTATGAGGGIYASCQASCGSLEQATLQGNTAGGAGGGLFLNGGLDVWRSVMYSNASSGGYGGAIVHQGTSPLTMTNVTVTGNTSTAPGGLTGGGIVESSTGSDRFLNDTIAWNTGGTYNGVLVAPAGSTPPQVENTIVASTTVGAAVCNQALQSQGYNIDSGAACGFTAPGDMSNTNPGLRPLDDNGGAIYTMAEKTYPVSPALDAGNPAACPIVDARWVLRPEVGVPGHPDVCDIGAYENGPTTANSEVDLSMTAAPASPNPGGTVTYTISFANFGPFATTGSLVTDTLPSTMTPVSCKAVGTSCSIQGQTAAATFASLAVVQPAPGQTILTIVATVNPSVPSGTQIVNGAITYAQNPDMGDIDNTATATVTVS